MSAPDSRFVHACKGLPVDRTPVWFMRQAGRYMSEYRALRERYSLLELCRTPDLATEVTLQPVRQIEVDAAILFSDLLLPLEPMGLRFDFVKGVGPVVDAAILFSSVPLPLEPMGVRFDFVKGEGQVVERPLRAEGDLAGLRRFEPLK